MIQNATSELPERPRFALDEAGDEEETEHEVKQRDQVLDEIDAFLADQDDKADQVAGGAGMVDVHKGNATETLVDL